MQPTTIEVLLTAYLNNTITTEALQQLQKTLANDSNEEAVKASLATLLATTQPGESYDPSRWSNIAAQIVLVDKPAELKEQPKISKATVTHRVHFLRTSWFRYVAVLLVLLAVGLAIRTVYHQKKVADIARRIQNGSTKDVPPGGDKAILTLADGTTIVLDSAVNGQLASRGNVQIVKLQNGQLKFILRQVNNNTENTVSQTNIITTPRGGQYQLELPDGTHIWLNAATTFTFPTAFSGNKRPVTLDGEAYFEVAKDAAHPFEVTANGTTVQVLGTHFNLNAYTDEKAVTTTLLEGKVQVQSGNSQVALLPGYQSESVAGTTHLNQHANTAEAVAWKEGYFQFAGADVQTIMRQIGRWYNVVIHYIGDVSSAHLTGEISRTLTLQQVMQVLKESGISVWLEGADQLYVAPGL